MKYKGILTELNRQRKSLTKQLERLENAISAIAGLSGDPKAKRSRKHMKFSKAGLERIAAAQRLRWRKIKAAKK